MTKRITLEDAVANFLPKPSNMPLNKDTFFTLTPDSEWQQVNYWVKNEIENNAQIE
jgi:hypothetical protein